MQIATWNVNSLKVRLPHVLQWLVSKDIDVLCLQETKTIDENFPVEALSEINYNSFFDGQKTYNGVAILVKKSLKVEPGSLVKGITHFEDHQKRLIALTINGIRVICGYFPNGESLTSDKFIYKINWLKALHDMLKLEQEKHSNIILLGDFNIAPEDQDVHDPAAWLGKNLVSPEERLAFNQMIALGFYDAFRLFDQPEKSYSWWDYRMLGFKRNRGLRIDHILISKALLPLCQFALIDKEPRELLQPSDHAPVIVQLKTI